MVPIRRRGTSCSHADQKRSHLEWERSIQCGAGDETNRPDGAAILVLLIAATVYEMPQIMGALRVCGTCSSSTPGSASRGFRPTARGVGSRERVTFFDTTSTRVSQRMR